MIVNNIDPILFEFSFLTIRWYGLFLGLGVTLGLLVLMRLFKNQKLNPDEALSIGVWLAIGGMIGARIGHILFYNLDYFLSNPVEILMINHGGLSSHGMAAGLIITFVIYSLFRMTTPSPSLKSRGDAYNWRKWIDLLVIPIPLIAGFIRIGNYFNSEIVGRATDSWLAIQFPLFELNPISRHPSQIYEALIAFSIFGILILVYRKFNSSDNHPQPLLKKEEGFDRTLILTHLFIFLYFSSRFGIEFLKEFHTLEIRLTMGQWLSLPFIFYSISWFAYKKIKTS